MSSRSKSKSKHRSRSRSRRRRRSSSRHGDRRRRSRRRSRSRSRSPTLARKSLEFQSETPSSQFATPTQQTVSAQQQVTADQVTSILRSLVAAATPASTTTTISAATSAAKYSHQQMLRGDLPKDLRFRLFLRYTSTFVPIVFAVMYYYYRRKILHTFAMAVLILFAFHARTYNVDQSIEWE